MNFNQKEFDFLKKYESEPVNFMKKKLLSIQDEVFKAFGSENLEIKKKYSKLELEKIEAEKKKSFKSCLKENSENLIPKHTANSFMSDVKLHKSKLELEREMIMQQKQKLELLKNKRQGNSLNECEDFSTMMDNSIRKKPTIQLEKEKFIEESKRKKEEMLKNRASLIPLKEQIIKFDEVPLNDNKENSLNSSNSNQNIGNTVNTVSISIPINPNSAISNSTCDICDLKIGKFSLNNTNYYKQFPKCKHVVHQKCLFSLKIFERNICQGCKKQKEE